MIENTYRIISFSVTSSIIAPFDKWFPIKNMMLICRISVEKKWFMVRDGGTHCLWMISNSGHNNDSFISDSTKACPQYHPLVVSIHILYMHLWMPNDVPCTIPCHWIGDNWETNYSPVSGVRPGTITPMVITHAPLIQLMTTLPPSHAITFSPTAGLLAKQLLLQWPW